MVDKAKKLEKGAAMKGGKPRTVTVTGKSFNAKIRTTKLNRSPVAAPQKPKA